jgi:hypothetical protein
MGIAQVETFLRRVMTDPDYCDRFLADPETALRETELDTAERWAVLESLRDGDESGHEFLALLRTRLAIIGVRIGQPPPDLPRVFASRPRADADPPPAPGDHGA